jgi:hypothetical protein
MWTIALGIAWLLVPAGSSSSTTVSSSGAVITESSTSTLLQNEGASVLVPLALPVLLAGVAVAVARSRHAMWTRFVAGGLLMAGCVLGAMSIGLPYVPAALALLLSGATTPPRSTAP